MLSFKNYVDKITKIGDAAQNNKDETLEGFLDNIIESENITVEEVVSGDIAQVTLPLMTLKRRKVYEVAPPDKDIENDFIKNNKTAFKKRYGKDWKEILYATAWKIYNKRKGKK